MVETILHLDAKRTRQDSSLPIAKVMGQDVTPDSS